MEENNRRQFDDTTVYLLNDKIDRVDDKLNGIDGKLESIDKTLIKQEENLKYHMLRTSLAEQNLELLKTYIDQETTKIVEKIDPIDKHVVMVKIVAKFLTGLLALVATLAGIYSAFSS